MRISPPIHSFQPGEDGCGCSIYDAVMGEPTATITLLKTLIQEWHPHAKTALELAVLPLDMVDKSTGPRQTRFGRVFGDEAVQTGLLFPA